VVTVPDEDFLSESKAALEDALYEFFESDDFYTVTSMSEMLETMTSMINLLVLVLAGIAAISLVVGGIGIMNIMWSPSPSAPGDRHPQIPRRQGTVYHAAVRIERPVPARWGGIIGILNGYGLSAAPPAWSPVKEATLTVSPSAGAVALAFGISVGIGIPLGYLPPKAGRPQPIDALHYTDRSERRMKKRLIACAPPVLVLPSGTGAWPPEHGYRSGE
jgi:putative ABC transport system permease protein